MGDLCFMKTTLEIPDTLFRRAKVAASRRHVSFRELVSVALERELASGDAGTASAKIIYDEDGMPCLQKRGAAVNDAIVRRIREAEGI